MHHASCSPTHACGVRVSVCRHQGYRFLEEKRDSEIGQLTKALTKEKKRRKGRPGGADAKITVLKETLERMKQEKTRDDMKRLQQTVRKEWKQKEKAEVASGKKPFFMKRSQERTLVTEKRFDELSSGPGGKKRVKKMIEKRRKRNAAQDKRWKPDGPPMKKIRPAHSEGE